jgi:hypothetical protein
MNPLVKKYREIKKYSTPPQGKEFHSDSSFWGIFGSTIPWAIWGYIIGAAIGLFIIIYYVAWPIFKILYVDPFIGGQ